MHNITPLVRLVVCLISIQHVHAYSVRPPGSSKAGKVRRDPGGRLNNYYLLIQLLCIIMFVDTIILQYACCMLGMDFICIVYIYKYYRGRIYDVNYKGARTLYILSPTRSSNALTRIQDWDLFCSISFQSTRVEY